MSIASSVLGVADQRTVVRANRPIRVTSTLSTNYVTRSAA